MPGYNLVKTVGVGKHKRLTYLVSSGAGSYTDTEDFWRATSFPNRKYAQMVCDAINRIAKEKGVAPFSVKRAAQPASLKQNPSYSNRIGRLRRLIQSQIEKLEAALKSHGKNSALYRKVEKALNRLIEMKRREVAKSRTPGTKAHANRWKSNPSPKFNIGESAYYVTGSGASRKRYLVEIVLFPKFDEYTNTYSYKVRGKTLPWSSGVWTHEGSLERVNYKKVQGK